MEKERNSTTKSDSLQENLRAPVTSQQNLEQSGVPQQSIGTTGPQVSPDATFTPPETKESPDLSQRKVDTPHTPEETTEASNGAHETTAFIGPQDSPNASIASQDTKEPPGGTRGIAETPHAPEETAGASEGLDDTGGSGGFQDTPDEPFVPPDTKEPPDEAQRSAETTLAPEETAGASEGLHDTSGSGGFQDTPNEPLVPPDTKEPPDEAQRSAETTLAPEETSVVQPDELPETTIETDHNVKEIGADSAPKGITDDPIVLPESSFTNDSPQAPGEENEGVSNPQSAVVDVPLKPSELDVFPHQQPETKNLPLESEGDFNNLPQDTVDVGPTLLEATDLQDEKGIPNEAPAELQEGTMSIMADSLNPFPIVLPSQVPGKSQNERMKKLSIDKIHRFSFKLSTLRAKQYEIIKKLRIMEAARPTFGFADLEIKTALSERKPEKEKLLYLFSENRRMEEKCFYGDIEIKKCEQMTSFYSGKRQEFLNILYTLSSMTHNTEAEDYLRSIKNDLLEALKATHLELEKHKQAMAVRNKDFQQLSMEMVKAAEANGVSQLLMKKLKKGTPLEDDEILHLTLEKCLETNYKLKTSIQSLGVQIDNLREQYLWKRNEFVTKLSSEFDTSFLITAPPDVKTPDESNPPTPTGSMFDLILEQSSMASRMARIGKNTEDLIKYHYKLKDLKSRIIATHGFLEPENTEGSSAAVLSGTPPIQRQ